MKKAQSVQEFVERFDAMKKKNPKDLSSDQDLTIAIMNLISIEEHLIFSGAKPKKQAFMIWCKMCVLKIIPSYEGEVWCISKHLLASSMRLMEVGTKQQSLGNTKEAYELFNEAYNLYCLFWGLNMGIIDTKDIQLEKSTLTSLEATLTKDTFEEPVKNELEAPQTLKGKLKNFIRKAVDCCIE